MVSEAGAGGKVKLEEFTGKFVHPFDFCLAAATFARNRSLLGLWLKKKKKRTPEHQTPAQDIETGFHSHF